MYIECKKKKIKIKELTKFTDRMKSYRFFLKPITEGLLFPKKHGINTYWFCQRCDIILTDKDNIIKYMYENISSEKIILPKLKVHNIYVLPLNSCSFFNIDDKIKLKK